MPQIAKIAVAAATYAIDKPYDYLAPDEAQVGQRVLVPFGKGNRTGEGVILSVSRLVPDKPLKAVREILDEEPLGADQAGALDAPAVLLYRLRRAPRHIARCGVVPLSGNVEALRCVERGKPAG